MFMGNVKAETKEELERLLNEKFPNDTYTVNALSPKDYVSNYDDIWKRLVRRRHGKKVRN